jgi:drug/metabolite transporter (DMT)-like permease
MGLFPVFSKIFSNNEPAPVMTFWTMAIGSVFLAAAANVKTFEMDWASAPLRLYLGIGYVTVFTTVITFLIIQYASKRLPVSKVMAYIYVIPVFVLVENIFLGFPFPDLSVIVGVVVVALGTFYFMKADKEA